MPEGATPERMKGKVKFFIPHKGYGFITGTNGREYFVHYSNIQGDGFKRLKKKQQVSFVPEHGPDGATSVETLREGKPKALDVKAE